MYWHSTLNFLIFVKFVHNVLTVSCYVVLFNNYMAVGLFVYIPQKKIKCFSRPTRMLFNNFSNFFKMFLQMNLQCDKYSHLESFNFHKQNYTVVPSLTLKISWEWMWMVQKNTKKSALISIYATFVNIKFTFVLLTIN